MELVERMRSFRRNWDAGDPNEPWYRRKRNAIVIFGCVVVLFAGIVLFFSGFFAGKTASSKEESHYLPPEYEPRVLPPVSWDGTCPRRSATCPKSFDGTPPLILVSLDGFHPDFMNRGFTPTIKNLAQCGVQVPFMYPVFPTKTFPNHFSQVTGLYPSSHGVIDNTMYDPFIRRLFKVGTPEMLEPKWWLKEPIWVTAQKQGKTAASFFWPGSEVMINGSHPTFWKKYNANIKFNARVDQILSWLDLPKESRPNLLTLYVNQPDHELHYFGLNSKQVNDALSRVDRMIERLFSGLQMRDLVNCVNVIIMSDHGMSDVSCKRVVNVEKFINVSEVYLTAGPFGRIRPKGQRNTTLVNQMVSNLRCQSPNMRAYAKEHLPLRMHYAESPRIEPIFLDLDVGWTIVSKSVKPEDSICTGGAHGYDNLFPDMRAIFLAHGPAFKKNYTAAPFINTELYELLAELLNIVPNPNNGTRGSLHHLLVSPQSLASVKEPSPPVVADLPNDEDEYNSRVAASGCTCSQSQKQVPVGNTAEVHAVHLPFGVPHSADDHSSLRLLYNRDYVGAFDLKYQMPLWSSFTISGQKNVLNREELCWLGDARLPVTGAPKCDSNANGDVYQRPLFPTSFSDPSSKEEASYVTNAVLKSQNFTNLLENPVNRVLAKWAVQSGELNILMGPAFNLLANEVKPPAETLLNYKAENSQMVPTHIFVVSTWCSERTSLNSCPPSKLETHAMLLPNKPFPVTCEHANSIIQKNAARVADVESLTGLSFFTGLPIYDAIRLRTMMPQRFL